MKGFKKLLVIILTLSFVTSAVFIGAAAASVAINAGTVSCDVLNVRVNPDTSSAVATTLLSGDTVIILDSPNSDWYHVSAYGTIGYVASQYINDVENAKNFAAAGALNGSDIHMRSTPSTSGDILGTYQSGTTMTVIGINNGWYKVKYDGNTGYIRSDFMDLTSGGTATQGQKIAKYAQQFNGYNYVYGAESPAVGFDCSGLMYYVYGQFGYSLSRTATTQYLNNGTSVAQANLQPGDLVFFQYDGKIAHVGMYIGDDKFIHACDSKTGVIISSLDSRWGTTAWYGAKRIVS